MTQVKRNRKHLALSRAEPNYFTTKTPSAQSLLPEGEKVGFSGGKVQKWEGGKVRGGKA